MCLAVHRGINETELWKITSCCCHHFTGETKEKNTIPNSEQYYGTKTHIKNSKPTTKCPNLSSIKQKIKKLFCRSFFQWGFAVCIDSLEYKFLIKRWWHDSHPTWQWCSSRLKYLKEHQGSTWPAYGANVIRTPAHMECYDCHTPKQ